MTTKILINGLILQNRFSGVHHSTEELILALNNLSPDYNMTCYIPGSYRGILHQMQHIQVKSPPGKYTNRLLRIAFENSLLPLLSRSNNTNIFHGPAYVLPFIRPAKKCIVTIHDLLVYHMPHVCQAETVAYFRTLLPHTIRQADLIITVSETVKEEICNRFRISHDRVRVVYHGISSRFQPVTDPTKLETIKKKYRLPPLFILYLGNLEAKKNLPCLIKAFAHNHSQHALVIAGTPSWGSGDIFHEVAVQGLQHKVHFPGYIPAEDLPALYTLADIFVFPSLYEGFGIPPLEAMACGKPVVTTQAGALSEITGGHCIQTEDHSPAALAQAMHTAIHDIAIRNEVIKAGLDWSKQFTWGKTARSTMDIYQSLM